MSPRNSKNWTAAENTALLAATGDRKITEAEWGVIAKQFPGRKWDTIRQQCLKLRRIANGMAPPPRKQRPSRANGRIDHRSEMQAPPAAHMLPRPVSLTAAIFGDPLPGRSALDRRG